MKALTPKQKQLFTGFSRLLKTRSMATITVTDLIKEAGVSRGTFYLYYQGIDDFVAQVESSLLNMLIKKQAPVLQGAIRRTSEGPNRAAANDAFLALARAIGSQWDLFSALASENGDPSLRAKLMDTLSDVLFRALPPQLENDDFFESIPVDYAMPMYLGTIVEILVHWLRKKKPESPEIVAETIVKSRYVPPYHLFSAEKS